MELAHFITEFEVVLREALVIHNGTQIIVKVMVALNRVLTILLLVHWKVRCRHPLDVHLQQGAVQQAADR